MPNNSSTPAGLLGEQMSLEKVARLLQALLPDEAVRIEISVRSLAPYSQSNLRGYKQDGSFLSLRGTLAVDDALDELRAVMYREGSGTWFSAKISVTSNGTIDASYNYDDEPEWSRPVESVWYVADQERFSRDEDKIPAWLSQKLTEGLG